jgi:hypothetical protein
LAARPGAAQTQVQARLTPPAVPPHGVAELAIEIRWEGFRSPQIDPSFELENLEIVDGPRRSSATTFLTGPASRGLTLTWRLRPQRLGPARVFHIRVRLDGTPYELPDARLEARTDAPEPPPPPPRLVDLGNLRTDPRGTPSSPTDPSAPFLRAEVSPRRPYRGQQTVYTLYIYYQSDVRNIQPREMPRFQGFWVREVEAGSRAVPTVEGGRELFRSVLLRRVLYPLRSGTLTITPTTAEMVTQLPGRRDRRPRNERVRRRSNAVTVEVRDLPAPSPEVPADFLSDAANLVGSLTASATVEPATVEVGEAAVWTVTLEGTAHLGPLPEPRWPALTGARLLPPETTSGEAVTGSTIRQLRRWQIPVVPESPGTVELPTLPFVHFDPAAGRYRVVETAPLRLTVVAPGAAAASPPPAPPPAHRRTAPWIFLPLVLALGGIALAGLWIRRRRRGHDRQRLLQTLTATPRHAEGRARKAAALVESAWRDFLEGAGYLPPGRALEEWSLALARYGARGSHRQREARREAAEELVEEIRRLARAPQLADTEALIQEVVRRSRRLLRHLPRRARTP